MIERLDAGGLALVAVDRSRADAGTLELLCEAIGAVLGAREDERLRPAALLDQVHQQVALVILLHAVGALLDQLDGRVARRHLDRQRVAQQALGERSNVVGVGRREQQVLPLRRQQLDDAPDVVNETHVEHAVRFIEHQHLDLGQIRRPLLSEVEQSTRRRHQNVAADLERADLRVDAHAAEHLSDPQRHVLAVIARALRHLRGQLARRREYERARSALARSRGGRKPLQYGQHEAGGLAGSGLRAGQYVAARKNRRDGLNLNGRGRVVALSATARSNSGLSPRSENDIEIPII